MQWSNCRSLKHTESGKNDTEAPKLRREYLRKASETPKHRNSCMYSESLIRGINEREIKNRYTGNSNTRAYNRTKCCAGMIVVVGL